MQSSKMLETPRGEDRLIPKLRNTRIRKNNDNIILQKPDSRKKLNVNKDLFGVLKLINGSNNIQDISEKLLVRGEQVKKILFSLEKDQVINLERNVSSAKPTICEYNFDYPIDMIYFEPTEKCNFKCIHCYASAPKKNDFSKELDDKGIEILINQLDDIGVLEVCFTGGEPFFSKKTLELSRKFHEKGIKLGYISNGSLINEEITNELKKLRPSFIRISFHSYEKEKFEKVTGTKNYDLVLRNLMSLQSEGIVPAISCTLFKGLNDSYKDIKGFLEFFKERGFNQTDITFDEFVPEGCGGNKDYYRVDEKESINRISKAFREVFNYNSSENKETPLKKSYCGVGISSIAVKSNGDLTLCPVLSKPILGNFLEREIKDIWETSNTFKYFRNKEYLEVTECRECDSLENCFGGCKAKSLTFFGKMNSVDPWMCAHLKK